MAGKTTPITIIESYFGRKLNRRSLKTFDKVSEDEWIAFAKHYLSHMELHFWQDFLKPQPATNESLRLYFEPRMRDDWDRAIRGQHGQRTPLLGVSPHPPSQETITRGVVSKLLDPLKKHLLLANSVYITDSFYYCFDFVADSVEQTQWRSDPMVSNLVRNSIRSLKNWLPILIELRDFIQSGALVFMPYYLTPSFPYGHNAPELKEHLKKIRLHPSQEAPPALPVVRAFRETLRKISSGEYEPPKPPSTSDFHFDENDALTAWLNGRVLHLDSVFPNRAMSEWASRLYFDDGSETLDITSDIISIEVIPFGGTDGIHLDDLWKMRRNEAVFGEVRRIVAACREYIADQSGSGASKQAINGMCRSFLHDNLQAYESTSILRFVDKPAVGITLSMAIGLAALPAAPAIGAIAALVGPFVTPHAARAIRARFDPTRRAYGHLNALL